MLKIGDFKANSCHGMSRRSFLTASATAPFWASAASASGQVVPPRTGKAKSVIFVFLWGAPSHLDTFDPKPDAPAEFRGPFSTIGTRLPGIRFSELVPRLAARNDRFSLVRSNISLDGGHPGAGTVATTGYRENPEPVQPSFGSIAARHFGEDEFPPYLMLGKGVPRDVVRPIKGYGGGRWGKAHDPFMIDCDESGKVNVPALKVLKGLSPERLQDRSSLTRALETIRKSVDDSRAEYWSTTQQKAVSLLTSPKALESLDLGRESEKTRNAYGQTSFGQSLLLARRLAEKEVPYIHVNWSEYVEALTPNTDFGWDTHIHNFDLLPNRHCPIFDRAFSALLDDLEERGLLDSTLVCCMGEFGRTPRINKRAARDHWPQCFFSIWAGAGIKPGRVVGVSDRTASQPVTDPVKPPAVGATILDQMGINSIVRSELDVLPDGEVIHDLV
ncbi:MAG: DUF1501 domain-containing protein [Planctomycetota bacterium]|nr:DUF1501 domain-containing protein [Planctomycetota bacterium]